MFEVGVVAHFEAAHRLHGDFGPARRTHGHTYRVEVSVCGPALAHDGTLCDIAALQAAVDGVVGALHFRDLDEVDGLRGQNTTAEVVADHICCAVGARLNSSNLHRIHVRLWESPHAYAAVERSLIDSVAP